MSVRPSVQPMLVICTFRITEQHYTYGCPTLIKAYVYEPSLGNTTLMGAPPLVEPMLIPFFWNQWVSLVLWVSSLKCSLLLLGLLTESVDHIRLMGARLNDGPP